MSITLPCGRRLSYIRACTPFVGAAALYPPLPVILTRLDAGAPAVITLALKVGAPVVLIGEKRGLKVARDAGLNAVGNCRILMLTEISGLLTEVQSHLYNMQSSGMRLSTRLIEWAIMRSGETP